MHLVWAIVGLIVASAGFYLVLTCFGAIAGVPLMILGGWMFGSNLAKHRNRR